MAFRIADCAIPTFYCGNENNIPAPRDSLTRYTGKGTAYQCMKKGIGAGIHQEREKNLPSDSLQRIKYVGPVFEDKFIAAGIRTRAQLKRHIADHSREHNSAFLHRIFTRTTGGLDKRAFNSTLVYLYNDGKTNIPQCSRITN